jgi:hypothetical protein
VRNDSFLGTIPSVPNLLRTIAAFGSHDTVPIVKVGIGASSPIRRVVSHRLQSADSGHAKTMAPQDLLRRISVGGLP